MARKKKKLPALNSSSMADIAFLLLTFFLLTSSINTDLGIQRRLPPPKDPNVEPPEIHKRNTFTVKVDRVDRLLIEGQIGQINDLKLRAKEFLSNPENKTTLPEKTPTDIDLIGKYDVSKGVISLQNDRGTSYDMYFMVQNELTAAVAELKDELARSVFGRGYIDCTAEQRQSVDKAIPTSISEAEPKNIGGK